MNNNNNNINHKIGNNSGVTLDAPSSDAVVSMAELISTIKGENGTTDDNLAPIKSLNPEFDVWIAEALTSMIYCLYSSLEVFPQTAIGDDDGMRKEDEENVQETEFVEIKYDESEIESSSNSLPAPTTLPPLLDKKKRSYSLNYPEPLIRLTSVKHSVSKQAEMDSLNNLRLTNSQFQSLPESLRDDLNQIYLDPKQCAESYVKLIIERSSLLPSFRDLSITACCLFGVEPASPIEEKEYITELTLRHIRAFPSNPQMPFGPEGTEWYLIPKPWIDSWRMFVGRNRNEILNFSSPQANENNFNRQSPRRSSMTPNLIDNWSILKKTGAKALLPGLVNGKEFEVITPTVFNAFFSWYGGGPAVSRRVVPIAKEAIEQREASKELVPLTEIEFYPLCLTIVECDNQGKVTGQPKEMLFSKCATVQDCIEELAREKKIEPNKIRLWNYAKNNWKEQFILSPELTMRQANLIDGQVVLLEASLNDGSWPRSLLHAYLDEEEKRTHGGQSEDSTEEEKTTGEEENEEKNQLVKKNALRRNDGLVGMDNLGNTCYLNSSFQALLHTDLLIEYFLSQSYIKDINVANKHGFGGRMANTFGKITFDLWTTGRDCITPRYVYNEIAALRDQFAGNEQHDAHELLAFLLDALSEDLNLVHSKPYTIQPDSDGRPDEELADIWWENHLKRDRSVIQALFTGQFKSIMTCNCGYSSARFEPFNFLTVPIPEDTFRLMIVLIVPRKIEDTAKCAIRVPKSGTVEDIIEKIKAMGFEGMSPGELHYFVAGELVNSRIKSFINLDRKVDTIRDNELLVLFHVLHIPKKMERFYTKYLQAPSPPAAPSQELPESTGDIPTEDKEQLAPLPSPPPSVDPNFQYVRVAFSQRRISYMEGIYAGVGGFDYFRLEPFGMPILEVLPNKVKGSELYKLMEERLRPYFKESIDEFRKNQSKANFKTSFLSGLHKNGESSHQSRSPEVSNATKDNINNLENEPQALADSCANILPVTTDEIVAGPIPSKGFSLRLITGGTGSSVCCSRCPWISRCQGCIIPDRDDVEYELVDGESLAVDWHFIIFEDLLDTQKASTLIIHQSIAQEKAYLADTKVPLSRCLDKFNEQETLEGVICPRCHEENTLKKTFMLWRLPPVLIVQLKRFQFDRTSRRKLNNRIDFPLENLDLTNYLAPTRLKSTKSHRTQLQQQQKTMESTDLSQENPLQMKETNEEEREGTPADDSAPPLVQGNASQEELICRNYDLYSVIHHIGALGGGHYVSTIRFEGKPVPQASSTTNAISKKIIKSFKSFANHAQGGQEVAAESEHSNLSNEGQGKFSWYLFNDNIVNEVTDLNEITSPSAYVLFYVRKDVENSHDIKSLLKSQLGHEYTNTTSDSTHGDSGQGGGRESEPKSPRRGGGGGERSATTEEEQTGGGASQRNQYILARKFPSPTKKSTNNNEKKAGGGDAAAGDQPPPRNPQQRNRQQQLPQQSGEGNGSGNSNNNSDNNCLVS